MINIFLYILLGLIIGFKIGQFIYQSKIKLLSEKIKSHFSPLPSIPASELEDKIWHERETEFVFNLNEQLSLTFERDRVARYLVESVNKFLYVEKTILLLLNNNADVVKIAYAVGLDKNMIEKFSLKREESVSGLVMSERKPLIIEDLSADQYLKKLNKEDYLRKSFISIPLIFQDEVLGVIHVCDKKPDKSFTKRDFSLMVNVGKISAIAFQTVLLHEQIQENYLKTIIAFASAIDARDHYTKCHSENVTRYSLAIAEEMKLSHYNTEMLRRASLLHDIGKIGIRDNILLKPDKLTPDEFEEIKLHPVRGEEIIKPLSFFNESAILIRHHHERYDGKGYPDGLKGEKIPLGARIMAVADTFDAMNSERPYRKPLSKDIIISEFEKVSGSQLDPYVVTVFLKLLEKKPDLWEKS